MITRFVKASLHSLRHGGQAGRRILTIAGMGRGGIGVWILLGVMWMAVLAPVVAPQNPYDLAALNILDGRLPPGARGEMGQIYWLGTDEQGRDLLSAMLYGLRISLGVAVISTVVALLLGATLGLLAGYRGGWVEAVVMRMADMQLAIPSILLAMVLLVFLRPGIGSIVLSLAAVQWAYYARTLRSAVLVEKQREYVEAARVLGLSEARIMFRHILPNCLPALLVVVMLQMAAAITLEATLSFLGLGVPVTEPSLGLLIANGFQYLFSGNYWISLCPGVLLLVTIAGINLVADRLADFVNPRLRAR